MEKTRPTFSFSDLGGGMSMFEGVDNNSHYFCYIFRRDSARIVCRPWCTDESHHISRPLYVSLQFNERPNDDICLWNDEAYVAACKHLGWLDARPIQEREATICSLREL